MGKFYAGIGSRRTPTEILLLFKKLAFVLAENGYVLRSGAAPGADQAFEIGCDAAGGNKEIYLPWKNFQDSSSDLFEVKDNAMSLARKFHPDFDELPSGAKKLIARNGYQILGRSLSSPVDFVLCYTNRGKNVGGTAQGIKIANSIQIPVFNAGSYSSIDKFEKDFSRFFSDLVLIEKLEKEKDDSELIETV